MNFWTLFLFSSPIQNNSEAEVEFRVSNKAYKDVLIFSSLLLNIHKLQ